jgi:glycine/D-amino acid oxidase-like deaminating enzyme
LFTAREPNEIEPVGNAFDDNRSVWRAAADRRSRYEPRAPLAGDAAYDVAIVGGGFTGTSTAWHLARRSPDLGVVVCEAKELGNGASGRNGGLVLNGVNGVSHADAEAARAIYEVTKAGIDAIESRIRTLGLDVPFRREGTLEILTDARRADEAAREVERLAAAGLPLRLLDRDRLRELARFDRAEGAVLDPTAGQIDGLALVRAMRAPLEEKGVVVHEGTPVLRVEEGPTVRLTTPGGTIRARAVVLATNAYTPRLGYFRSGIVPLFSHLIATEPLDRRRWEEIGWGARVGGFSDDLDRLSYGGLTERGELVFGGGSNAAYGYGFGGATALASPPPRAFGAIEATLRRYLPKTEGVRVAHRWTGPIALTMSRVCTMGVRGSHRNVYFALGYSGHGITLANLAGEVLADLHAGDAERWRSMPFFQQKLLWVPPEPIRWAGYHLVTAVTGKSPRRSL